MLSSIRKVIRRVALRVVLPIAAVLLAAGAYGMPACHTANADQVCADTYLANLKQFPEHSLDTVDTDRTYTIAGTDIVNCVVFHGFFGGRHCAWVDTSSHRISNQQDC